jgi:AcrR family transcriptional regulator
MSTGSLGERFADLARGSIIAAGMDLVVEAPDDPLSVRSVANRAGMSERTVFRYFATRDILLDEVAAELASRVQAPPVPGMPSDLTAYARDLYRQFETKAPLIKAALRSELYNRVRHVAGDARGRSIRHLIDNAAPAAPDEARRAAAANIHYHLVATTWHYYRFYFDLSLEESTRCAEAIIEQALGSLGISPSS